MSENKQVVISIQGALESGEVFEQTPTDHPIPIVLGKNNIFPKLEEALTIMQPGETRTISLTPEEAYGPHHENLVQSMDASSFNKSIQPAPGMLLSLNVERNGKQEKVPATVLSVDDDKVMIDFNHPLAGKTVVYTLTLHDYL